MSFSIHQILCCADQESLVVFDIDETIVMQADALFHPKAKEIAAKLVDQATHDLDEEEKQNFYSKLILAPLKLVDPDVVNVISYLQQRSIKVMAITACPIRGRWGVIEKMEDKRIKELQHFGVDFNAAFPHIDELELPECKQTNWMPPTKNGITFGLPGVKVPFFKRGIIFGCPKGDVLSAFLDHAQWKPKRIIFIDDFLEFVNSMEEMAEKRDIDFVGIHYTAAQAVPCDLNEEMMKFQLDYFAKTRTWLCDDEAKMLLKESGTH